MFISAPFASSQEHHRHDLSTVIDGRTNPELIPDELAYEHFILAISERQAASELEVRRREAFLRPLGLSSEDRNHVIFALTGVREALDAVEAKRQSLSAGTDPDVSRRLIELKAERNTILKDARNRLHLSSDGKARFDNYVKKEVKRRIVVLGAQ
jgi:hypothetical protein